MNEFRYWLGRRLRALAKHVEPTVTIDWQMAAHYFNTDAGTSANTTWTHVTTTYPPPPDKPKP